MPLLQQPAPGILHTGHIGLEYNTAPQRSSIFQLPCHFFFLHRPAASGGMHFTMAEFLYVPGCLAFDNSYFLQVWYTIKLHDLFIRLSIYTQPPAGQQFNGASPIGVYPALFH
jgi:hypothetical protein